MNNKVKKYINKHLANKYLALGILTISFFLMPYGEKYASAAAEKNAAYNKTGIINSSEKLNDSSLEVEIAEKIKNNNTSKIKEQAKTGKSQNNSKGQFSKEFKKGTAETEIIKKFYTSSLTPDKRKEFHDIITQYKKNRKKAEPSYSLYIMGLIREISGEPETAISVYEKLIDLYPKSKNANLSKERISECYLALGNKENAIENYLDYYKWKISEGKREEILFKIAKIYNQTLTTFEAIIKAYKAAAENYEYSKGKAIDYLVGYFKGFHLLDAHMATFYYRRIIKEYPDGLYKFEALLNMSIIFAYDLSDIETAKKLLIKLDSEKSEYVPEESSMKIKRLGRMIFGLLCLFHSPEAAAPDSYAIFKKIVLDEKKDSISCVSSYYLGYYYENMYSVAITKNTGEIKFNEKSKIENYIAELANDSKRNYVDNAISAYMLGFFINKDDFYAEESAYRASFLLINYYSDIDSVKKIYKMVKKSIKSVRREKDFEDLINLKLPQSFDKNYSALYSKEKKLYETSQYKQAIETHEEIVSKSGKGAEAEFSMYEIARIYEEDLKDYDMAVNTYKRFIEKFPGSPRIDKVIYQTAKIYEKNLLDLNEAVKYYNKLMDEGHDQLWIFQAGVDLCELYTNPALKKDKEIEAVLEKLLIKVPMREDEVLYKIAELKQKSNKKGDAQLETFEKIVRDYPESIYFENSLDKLLSSVYKDNLSELSQKIALAKTKKEITTDEILVIMNEKLEKEKFIGNQQEASGTLNEMKKLASGSDETILIEKQILELQLENVKESDKAIAGLKELAQKAAGLKSEPEILYAYAKALDDREKDYKNAVREYEKIIKMNKIHSKTQMMALFKAGIIYALNFKDYENAFRCYSLIMAKYSKEAREEKLDAKIANLLNVDLSILQSYLGSYTAQDKSDKATKETELIKKVTAATEETALENESGGIMDVLGTIGKTIIGAGSTSENILASEEPLTADETDEIIEETPSWFSKASRPGYESASWFKKGGMKAPDADYSWFQKPVDLSDIGITTPTWFKQGGLKIKKAAGKSDPELEKLKAELMLPVVRTSKTGKYLNYIENNPNSPKLPIIYYYLGLSYEENEDYKKAAESYTKIIDEYNSYAKITTDAYERLAVIYAEKNKDFGRALYLVSQMKEKMPKSFTQGDAIAAKIKNYQKISDNEKYIKNHLGDEKCLELMYENAKIYENSLKDYNNAISYLNKCTAYINGETEEIKYKLEIVRICTEKTKNYELALDEYQDILERFPSATEENEIRYRAAEILINNFNKKEDAVALLEKVKTQGKKSEIYKDAMLLLNSAYSDDKINEKADTVATLKQVIPELKLSSDVQKQMKKIEIDKKAADLLEIIETNEENPSNVQYMYYIARLYEREAEDYESAAKYYKKLIEMKINDSLLIQAISSLGLIYETKLKKPQLAIDLYREFIVKNIPDDIDFLAFMQFKIGEDYELLKKRKECIEAYRKVRFYFPVSRWAKTADDRVEQILAMPDKFITLYERPKYEDDETTMEIAVAEKKGTFEVALATGEISFTSAEIEIANEKDPEKKIEKLQALIDNLPEKDKKIPIYLIEMSKVCDQTKKIEKSTEALKRIIDEFPKYERYYDVALKLAESYRAAGNVEEAARYYKQIVQESPQYDKTEYVRYMLGKMYIEKREYVYAIETFQELVDRYQDSMYAKTALYEKGLVNERYMKDYDAAIRDFEQMVDRYFDHENAPDAQIEIAWIYENAKYDLPKAKEAYNKALEKFPNTPKRREIIDAIERINSKLPK